MLRRRISILFVVALAATALYARANGGDEAAMSLVEALRAAPRIEVEASVLSGRPDPRWPLGDRFRPRLLDAVAALLSSEEPPPAAEGLGYRGLTMRLPSALGAIEVVAFDRRVVVRQGGAERVYLDPERRVERCLLESGREVLDRGLRLAIEEHLAKP